MPLRAPPLAIPPVTLLGTFVDDRAHDDIVRTADSLCETPELDPTTDRPPSAIQGSSITRPVRRLTASPSRP